MNGVRSTFMRRGYLLTALSALLLLAASSGTAEAQRVTIGFTETSGAVSENAYLNRDALAEPQRITVRVEGLRGGARRVGDITASLGANITITPDDAVFIGQVGPTGDITGGDTATAAGSPRNISTEAFNDSDEVVLVVAQTNGTGDGNWVNETIELKLRITATASTASVSPDVYTLEAIDSDVAPVARFLQPSFTLTEGSEREIALDVTRGSRSARRMPPDASTIAGAISVRVSNHQMVTVDAMCPPVGHRDYNTKVIRITPTTGDWAATAGFAGTGVLQTADDRTVGALSAEEVPGAAIPETSMAGLTIEACQDGAGFRDPQVTLTILDRNLKDPDPRTIRGHVSAGSPLTVTVDSNEAAPTLSFSPTDVTIDEGDSVSTRLIADGMSATEVGMVKLMVEGDAMVDLYHEDTMLEEMDGYVMVDMGMGNSARLTAMSMESRELQDGDMAYKAWKLVDDSSDAMIGDDSWFRVDVRGSTAVPALPLIGQLLLALFLMAGGSKLYRRRRG